MCTMNYDANWSAYAGYHLAFWSGQSHKAFSKITLTVYLKTATNRTCKVKIKVNSVERTALLIESDRNRGMQMF